MGLDTPHRLLQQFPGLCDITHSKNKPVVFRRIPETDPDAILRKTPAELSKKSRLACNTPFVLVKHYYVRYRSDSDP
jgi:hypothetical protein